MTTPPLDPPIPLSAADELLLAERLIAVDTSTPAGISACVEYLKGWLEARDIAFTTLALSDGLPVLSAKVGEGPITIVFHAHVDVVPGSRDQFSPWNDGEFLWGRGAYDMKGATAAMCAAMADLAATPPDRRPPVSVRLLVVPDEESDEERQDHGTDVLVREGHVGDFVICGEPTDLHVGIQAKGVLDVRIDVRGHSAHGATPWLGVNAIERAMDVYDQLLRLPFARESSHFFDRPSINLGRISGGVRLNQVPDVCTMEIDIRFLPEQPLDDIRRQLGSLPGCHVHELNWRPPAKVGQSNPFLAVLREAIGEAAPAHDVMFVGRDGTNDGIHFLKRGIPSVEFGPVGVGHHGPEERVSVASLRQYRNALLSFVLKVDQEQDNLVGVTVPKHLSEEREEPRALL